MNEQQILRGQVLTFDDSDSYHHWSDGAVAIEGQSIVWVGAWSDCPAPFLAWPKVFYDGLILPGFVDAHLHYPQSRILGAYGLDLLDWLDRNTFPEEARFGDGHHAAAVADWFCDELVNHGITSALAFSTIHPIACDTLFTAAAERGLAITSGKTMMDRNAPLNLRDTPQMGYDDSAALIGKWHGKGRARYAITPRFAVTSTPEQLEATAALMAAHPDLLMQTHLSESPGEIATIAELFPLADNYLDVYARFGLLTENSVFAHAIYLDDGERARLSEVGAAVVHCPTSNNFLGSGLFTEPGLDRIGIGCDIGGGTSFSMLHTLGEAHKVAALSGQRLDPLTAFYRATLGNAKILKRQDEIGSLQAGKSADITVLSGKNKRDLALRLTTCETLTDVLFAYMMLGDDRAIEATWCAGTEQKGKL